MCNCSGFIGQEENEFLGLKPFKETKLGQTTGGKILKTASWFTPIGFLANVGYGVATTKKGGAVAPTGTPAPSGAREVSEEERNADGSPSSNTGLYIGIGVGVIILIVVGIFLYKKFSK